MTRTTWRIDRIGTWFHKHGNSLLIAIIEVCFIVFMVAIAALFFHVIQRG